MPIIKDHAALLAAATQDYIGALEEYKGWQTKGFGWFPEWEKRLEKAKKQIKKSGESLASKGFSQKEYLEKNRGSLVDPTARPQ